jgi:hypothetical protein
MAIASWVVIGILLDQVMIHNKRGFASNRRAVRIEIGIGIAIEIAIEIGSRGNTFKIHRNFDGAYVGTSQLAPRQRRVVEQHQARGPPRDHSYRQFLTVAPAPQGIGLTGTGG